LAATAAANTSRCSLLGRQLVHEPQIFAVTEVIREVSKEACPWIKNLKPIINKRIPIIHIST
jgi:hypothetical protein